MYPPPLRMPVSPPRPPALLLDDDAAVRSDLDSDDVRRVYPTLPATSADRLSLLLQRDARAYRATPGAPRPPALLDESDDPLSA